MEFPPLALLPCRLMLRLAGTLVTPANRSDWEEEWFAELWYRLLDEEREIDSRKRHLLIYRMCLGCFKDAWWHFNEDGAGRNRIIEQARSPGFCLAVLSASLLACVVVSGYLPATRQILFPQPYIDEANIAVVSRTGRLQPVRRGIPHDLALEWKKQSRLVMALAMCSFPHRARMARTGRTQDIVLLKGTPDLISVLDLKLTAGGLQKAVFLSHSFWRREFHADRRVIRTVVKLDGEDTLVAGVLPQGFWFLSPRIDIYRFDTAPGGIAGMLVARCKRGVSAPALEEELGKSAIKSGYEFAQTAPHAIFLGEAMRTPLWLFWAALFFSAVLVVLAHGSRWIRIDESGDLLARRNWRLWGFFALKTTIGLAVVLVLGIEIFVGKNQQTISEALGGPSLIWFYVVGCSLVLLQSISDQHARCRVCQRLLAFPIRIGCPGCLFLDWAGTEFLCPHGHGMLYVPHHVSCWEETDRWVVLEA
jgi:hypothetical protein